MTKAYETPKGKKAKASGKLIKRGRVMSFTIYPRPRTKAALVAAAKRDKRSVANYILHRAMVQLAKELRVALDDLLPREEFEALVNKRFRFRTGK